MLVCFTMIYSCIEKDFEIPLKENWIVCETKLKFITSKICKKNDQCFECKPKRKKVKICYTGLEFGSDKPETYLNVSFACECINKF